MKRKIIYPLAVSLVVLNASMAFADPDGYLVSEVVKSNHDECWQVKGGMPKPVAECGDVMPAPPPDADVDGVVDELDECPNTPLGVSVTPKGCPWDSDGDGVPDYKDDCPDTLPGMAACNYGCGLSSKIVINLNNDEFEFDSAVLKPEMKVLLDDLAGKFTRLRDVEELMVIGHTCSIGTEAYNQKLSERRAAAVKAYLVSKGVSADLLKTSGQGESNPIVSNDTKANRSKNRRVEIHGRATTEAGQSESASDEPACLRFSK